MAMAKCPGQDSQFWKPGDVSEVTCPHCKQAVEVWKDDVWRNCPHCGERSGASTRRSVWAMSSWRN